MKQKRSKLTLEKFSIHKLNNLSKISGGNGDDGDKTDRKKGTSTVKCLMKVGG